MYLHTHTCILITMVLEFVELSARLDEFTRYEVIIPMQDGRTYSGISNKLDIHKDETIFEFFAFKKNFRLHLFKNKLLIPPGYEMIEQYLNGSMFGRRGLENCHYQGIIGNRSKAYAVMDTCNGLNGFFQDEDDERYGIKPFTSYSKHSNSLKHIIYRIDDVLNGTKRSACGLKYFTRNHTRDMQRTITLSGILPNIIQGTQRSRDSVKYISVIVIMDNASYKEYGDGAENRALSIMNNVDMIYRSLRTRIAVQALIIWKTGDEVKIVSDASKTLNNFEGITRDVFFGEMDLNADFAVLITRMSLKDSVVGLAGVGTMCTTRSCAVIEDYNSESVLVANTVAHEVGHALGFQHTLESCKCPHPPCVMGEYSPGKLAKSFTDCAQAEYYKRLDTGRLTCLFDYPTKLYGKPRCGNGFIETGEDCDCGTVEECKKTGADECCIPKTCKLQKSSACATGACCKDCQLVTRSTLCRIKYDKECDLPEYCTGKSSHCPENTYVKDGHSCFLGNGSCYHGSCKSLETQCQILWGPNAVIGNDGCFNLNTKKNNAYANCGKTASEFISCSKENMFCGKLQCASKDKNHPLPKYPIIGQEVGGRRARTVVFNKYICHMAYVPFNKDMQDPSMAHSGTRCGEEKICEDHQCKNISDLKWSIPCSTFCFNGGVCNNKGNCHCQPGFACPTCEQLGPGGSMDSGQGCISQDKFKHFPTVMKISLGVSVGVISFIVAFVCLIVKKRHDLARYPVEMQIRWLAFRSRKKHPWQASQEYTQKRVNNSYENSNPNVNECSITIVPPPKPLRKHNISLNNIQPEVAIVGGNGAPPKPPHKPMPTTSNPKYHEKPSVSKPYNVNQYESRY